MGYCKPYNSSSITHNFRLSNPFHSCAKGEMWLSPLEFSGRIIYSIPKKQLAPEHGGVANRTWNPVWGAVFQNAVYILHQQWTHRAWEKAVVSPLLITLKTHVQSFPSCSSWLVSVDLKVVTPEGGILPPGDTQQPHYVWMQAIPWPGCVLWENRMRSHWKRANYCLGWLVLMSERKLGFCYEIVWK